MDGSAGAAGIQGGAVPRLGRGAGWYDRALLHASPQATIIGVCWPWEANVHDLPRDPHDVPVGGILTPESLTIFD